MTPGITERALWGTTQTINQPGKAEREATTFNFGIKMNPDEKVRLVHEALKDGVVAITTGGSSFSKANPITTADRQTRQIKKGLIQNHDVNVRFYSIREEGSNIMYIEKIE